MNGAVAQRQSARLTSAKSEVRPLPAPRSRYLTPLAKVGELQRWHRLRAEADRDGYTGDAGRLGGHGYVDRGILPLVDALNAIEGVCTLQSCDGHEYPNGDGTTTISASGLWLWLDESLARAFYERAEELAEHRYIEQVAILWGRDREREIVDVIFRQRGGLDVEFLPRWLSGLRSSAC